MKYQVRDTGTKLVFEGQKLATSSSKAREPRWVEFTLYKAATGQYVVERIGKSIQFHKYDCNIVERNRLHAVEYEDIPLDYIPCPKCRPSRIDPDGLFPERERPYFQVCESAAGVVHFLEQEDNSGSRYLTNVAKNLLGEASKYDKGIYNSYVVRTLE